ncbi:MAG: DIP1984 family protein [Clostridia bacterium]|nr:DIP1984 family protein [Clostridia bacterium]
MKLAEALQERADLSRRISQLRSRIVENALVQEGEEPPEEPRLLLEEMNRAVERQAWLVSRINLTNSRLTMDGEPVTVLLARRDALQLKIRALQDICSEVGDRRYTRSRGAEIRVVAAVDVAEMRKEADALSRDLRLLDNRLQQCDWTEDLME